MLSEIVAAVIGAALGSGSAIGWEVYLKPRRERVKIARTLRVEVAENRQTLIAVREHAKQTQDAIPLDFYLATTAFDSLLSNLGELSTDEVTYIVAFYGQVRYLNHLVGMYRELRVRLDDAEDGSARKHDLDEQMRNTRIAFYESVRAAIDYADSAFSRLDKLPGEKERLGAPHLSVQHFEQQRQNELRKKQGY